MRTLGSAPFALMDPGLEEPTSTRHATPEPRRPRVALRYWGALALYIVLGAFFIHDWDGYVFERTVRDFWEGESPYTVAAEEPYYTFLSDTDEEPQWYAYPPLPLLAMTLSFIPEFLFNVPPFMERVLLKLPMILGTLGLARVGGLWARHLGHGQRITVRVERLLLFNPLLVLVGPMWGMTDPALMALFLFGLLRLDQGRGFEAGVWLGLSALVKPFPLFLGIPLVAYYLHRHSWRPLLHAAATGIPTMAFLIMPFALAHGQAFWNQVVGMHLAREAQGLTLWALPGLDMLPSRTIQVASVSLMAISLLLVSWFALRMEAPTAPLMLTMAAALGVLIWNRVLNEQYLALVVAPLVLMAGVGVFRETWSRIVAHGAPQVFAVVTLIQGFHFLTLIPPDVALWLLGRPVDSVARDVGIAFNWGLDSEVAYAIPVILVLATLGVLAAVGLRSLAAQARQDHAPRRPRAGAQREVWPASGATTASLIACLGLLLVGFTPLVSPTTHSSGEALDWSVPEEPLVGAFYYLWWHNAAHDPETRYGNWLEVSQSPEIGYYSNTRGVHREHVQMMRENGIDVAILSYHTGELARYQVFQEEAGQQGLLVAPLIELNQIYDIDRNRPENRTRDPVQYAAFKLTDATRTEIEDFVLELKDTINKPNQYRVDGRPVIYFYDSYVSGFGFSIPERVAHAQTLLSMKSLEELRDFFDDPALEPTVDDVLKYYPISFDDLYLGDYSAFWRQAHLELHQRFWIEFRANIEEQLGPVFLVSGDAFNDRAGFEAGTVKSLVGLRVFDGSFIYSPSFTWGNYPQDPYMDNFARWEDRNLWLVAFGRGLARHSSFGIAPSYDDTVKRETGFVIPAYPFGDERSTYGLGWESALSNPPSLVLLSTFNEFFEGSSVEPSIEYGNGFLNVTLDYRNRLEAVPAEPASVVTVVHEYSSRTHPNYNDRDLPHEWGLRLVAAASRAFPGEVLAYDAWHSDAFPDEADLVLVDGGRDDYGMSKRVVGSIDRWTLAGVPVVVFGPQVSGDLRNHELGGEAWLSSSCQGAVEPVPGRDALIPGDTLFAGTDGRIYVQTPTGDLYGVGQVCEDRPNVAFVAIKPWRVREGAPPTQEDKACLRLVLSALFEESVSDPSSASGCRTE